MLVDGMAMVLDLAKSTPTHLWDAKTNRKYLDFFSFFATAPLGCNHPGLLDTDFEKKITRAAINNPSNSDIYTSEMAEFVDTFEKIALPKSMKYLFFIAGGSPAVENALKVAFDWKVRENFARGKKDELGHQIIHFKEAFHGRTGYTGSMTNTWDERKTKYFAKFSWPRITNPKIRFPLTEENLKNVELTEQKALEEIDTSLNHNPDDIAGLIVEPIQGEGGDNHFRGEFLRELRRICDENELLYILDEVQTGVGATGEWWCYQHFDFEPDIVCFGKKMQVCGIMCNQRVDEVENNVFKESSRINSTWGGNLVDMVRATKYLEIIQDEKLVDNAKTVGNYCLSQLKETQQSHPDLVSNARGRGLMIAFDLPSHMVRDKLKDKLYELGLLVLGCGEKTIRFRPPLLVGREQVDEAMGLLERALDESEKE